MPNQRLYALRDPELLRKLMRHPGRGTEYSVRDLAATAGCKRATIGNLLTGYQASCEMETAHDIAEAVGVAVLVLFAPPASPPADKTSRNSNEGAA